MSEIEITDAELNEMHARVEKATPGPWTAEHESWAGDNAVLSTSFNGHAVAVCGEEIAGMDYPASADAAFIAHARQDIERLLAYVDQLLDDRAQQHAWRDAAMEGAEPAMDPDMTITQMWQALLDARRDRAALYRQLQNVIAGAMREKDRADEAEAELNDLRGELAKTEANFTEYAEEARKTEQRLNALQLAALNLSDRELKAGDRAYNAEAAIKRALEFHQLLPSDCGCCDRCSCGVTDCPTFAALDGSGQPADGGT